MKFVTQSLQYNIVTLLITLSDQLSDRSVMKVTSRVRVESKSNNVKTLNLEVEYAFQLKAYVNT